MKTAIIENADQERNWAMFYTSASRRWSDSSELDEKILRLAREGVPRKEIKKRIGGKSRYVDSVIMRARRRSEI